MPGIVYLLTNQAMPGLVKIGHIKDSAEKNARDRMREQCLGLLINWTRVYQFYFSFQR